MKPIKFSIDLDAKALGDAPSAQLLEDGDILITGIGANYDLDREDEAFLEGAFTKGLNKFLSGAAPLCFHHRKHEVIGRVIAATPIPGRGIEVKAIVHRQPESSPLFHIYQGIKKGSINGLSVGGIFKRVMTEAGPRISDVDIVEWSATATPVGKGSEFSVVAGKALTDEVVEEETNLEVIPNSDEDPTAQPPESTEEEPNSEGEGAEDPQKTEEEPAPKLTGADIEPGIITADHLSPELRSHFKELDPEMPKIDRVADELQEVKNTLDALSKLFDDTEETDYFKRRSI
jgi:hypothetical protein